MRRPTGIGCDHLLVDGVRRRAVIAFVGGLALWPLSGTAQTAKTPTIGVLVVQAPGLEQFWRLFRDGLRELGYVEGQSIKFEFRSDEGQVNRLPELAADLVRLKVDLIVTWFTPAARAAKQATREIPIVMALAGNPVETGLVESLARPGGNVTGMAGVGAELAGKSVDLIRDMIPSAHRVAALANAPDPFAKPFVESIRQSSDAVGITMDPIMVQSAGELDAAFTAMQNERPDAVIVQPSLTSKRAAQLALSNRTPAVSLLRDFADEGGLMSYFSAEADMYRRAAALVDKVLKGARPAELPVEQPTHFEIVINLNTAKSLGLVIPPLFLARADEVIE